MMRFENFRWRLAIWYKGRVVPHEDRQGSITVLGWGYRRHWTAEVAHGLAAFWLRHWQWTIGTAIAVVGLYVGYLAISTG